MLASIGQRQPIVYELSEDNDARRAATIIK